MNVQYQEWALMDFGWLWYVDISSSLVFEKRYHTSTYCKVKKKNKVKKLKKKKVPIDTCICITENKKVLNNKKNVNVPFGEWC